jgi:leucine dehydrogenase
MFESAPFDAHEAVTFVADAASGLKGIVAIHSTRRGPAFGGCRAWSYASSDDALADALRLSRGMSYKNAIAGLPFGGGKAVILREPQQKVTEAQFEAFGRAVDRLNGRYITAEDVGVSVEDMQVVSRQTRFVSGLMLTDDAAIRDGDPSPRTALGVFIGLKAAVRARLGRDDLNGVRVAVQGLGHVGYSLCELLYRAGAQLTVSDLNDEAVRRARDEFNARPVASEQILLQDVDVLSPCALGGILNSRTIPLIKAAVIAGAANNQLELDADGQRLHERGILYAPDYVINAGGIIWVAAAYLRDEDQTLPLRRIEQIGKTLSEIFEASASRNLPTSRIADERARQLLD